MHWAQRDLWVAAECILASRGGDLENDDAMVGAMLEAESFNALRLVRAFLTAKKG